MVRRRDVQVCHFLHLNDGPSRHFLLIKTAKIISQLKTGARSASDVARLMNLNHFRGFLAYFPQSSTFAAWTGASFKTGQQIDLHAFANFGVTESEYDIP